jgi:tetratricopeptide (TPR) repeat protein
LVKGKKLSRKEIKQPDEFITVTHQVIDFIMQYKVALAVTAGLIVVLIVIVTTVASYTKNTEKQAQNAIYAAMKDYYAEVKDPKAEADKEASADKAVKANSDAVTYATASEKWQAAAKKLEDFHSRFPSSNTGKLSMLYIGNSYYELADYAKAIEWYEKFIQAVPSTHEFVLLAYNSLGYSYEQKGEYQKAIDAYKKIVDQSKMLMDEQAYLNMGRCYEQLKAYDKAIEMYENIKNKFPQSVKITELRDKIDLLKENLPATDKDKAKDGSGNNAPKGDKKAS